MRTFWMGWKTALSVELLQFTSEFTAEHWRQWSVMLVCPAAILDFGDIVRKANDLVYIIIRWLIYGRKEWRILSAGIWRHLVRWKSTDDILEEHISSIFSDPEDEGDIFRRNVVGLTFQRTTRRYISETRTLHNHCCENLISYIKYNIWFDIFSFELHAVQNKWKRNDKVVIIWQFLHTYSIPNRLPVEWFFTYLKTPFQLYCDDYDHC
jgi:hypothetical protein